MLQTIAVARETVTELLAEITYSAILRGCHLSAILGSSRDDAVNLARSMPTSEVATLLKTEDHRNRDKRWTRNDIYDIDALSIVVPYCDIVVTDAHRCRALQKTGLPDTLNTVAVASLDALADLLEEV